jgi:hypothetical protein
MQTLQEKSRLYTKNLQQNITKLNPLIYKKSYMPQPNDMQCWANIPVNYVMYHFNHMITSIDAENT